MLPYRLYLVQLFQVLTRLSRFHSSFEFLILKDADSFRTFQDDYNNKQHNDYLTKISVGRAQKAFHTLNLFQ